MYFFTKNMISKYRRVARTQEEANRYYSNYLAFILFADVMGGDSAGFLDDAEALLDN